MSEEDIRKTVGRRYDYSEDIRMGRVNVKNLEKRDIHPIEFKTIFSLNANSLQTKEQANQQRRLEEASARQRREEERRAMTENGNINNINVQQKKKKVQAPVVVLTEEERKRQS